MARSASPIRALLTVLLGAAALAAAPAAASPFGINAHVPPQVVIDEVAAAGISWVRIDFMWSLVEAEPDVYDWQVYDSLIERLEAQGIRAYATLQATPAWATDGREFSGVPRDPAQWQEFVYLAADRYRGRIPAWGMWNEPNLPRFWDGSRREYLDTILLPGARAVRAADPGALVCGPDLAHLSSADWDRWLREVIAEAGELLDVVTHHVYPGGGGTGDVFEALHDPPFWEAYRPSVRQVLQDSGWWGRPFWLTETGVESGRAGVTGQALFYDGIVDDWFGPDPRARWLDRVFFYQIHDPPAPDASTFGILTAWPEIGRKNAYYAYANAIAATSFVDGEVLAIDAPAFVAPGQVVEIIATLRNTGTETWRGDAGYHLEVETGQLIWRVLTDRLATDFEVPPGTTVQATIPVQAPWAFFPSSATATIRARMVDGDGRRFGDPIRAVVTAARAEPPQILRQPRSAPVPPWGRAVLRVETTGGEPLSYQWRRNSVDLVDDERIRGSRSPRLELRGLDPSLAGDFHCVVSNAAGATVSTAARIALGTPPPQRSSATLAPSPVSGTLRQLEITRAPQ
ncbi:MAG TPA: beta-galactosidase [Chondromyces sp.]|nr:beta-galactosidase [Chondromyces sp.]